MKSLRKSTRQLLSARKRYQNLTNLTRDQMKELICLEQDQHRPSWSHNHYHTNQIFSPSRTPYDKNIPPQYLQKNNIKNSTPKFIFPKSVPPTTLSPTKLLYFDGFPSNTAKYNAEFIDRSLQGGVMKHNQTQPIKRDVSFKNPEDTAYSAHFRSKIQQTRKQYQNVVLRKSLFSKIDLDFKKDIIMDQYKLQANPFKTQFSNSLFVRKKKSWEGASSSYTNGKNQSKQITKNQSHCHKRSLFISSKNKLFQEKSIKSIMIY